MKYCLLVTLLTLITGMVKSQSQTSKSPIFFEKVHLRSDRQIYVAGDDLWFSAFLVNAQDNRPIATSNTLYVELSPLGKTGDVKKQIVELKHGEGHGDFKLDEQLESGIYILRAWTNWMRNFGNNFVFEKDIKIVAKPEKETDGKIKKSNSSSKKTKGVTGTPTQPAGIRFLPEGGSLIEGVTSLVAFKTTNEIGVKGVITNSDDELVTTLESEKGIGAFMFKPVAGQTYQVEGRFSNGRAFEQKLPVALTKGYGMYVVEKDSVYQIIISTNAASSVLGKDVLLMGKSHGRDCFKKQFTVHGMQQSVKVYKTSFPEGIASITLYDSEGRPNCERLIYVDYKSKPILRISTEKQSYLASEKVRVNLKVSDADNKPLQGHFSIAAVYDDFAEPGQSDIRSYLMLESELKGKIENPRQYFDKKNTNRKKELDLLMLTQGWRDFLWKRMADTAIKISRIPEAGITISGSVKRKIGDAPIANSNVTIRSRAENQSQLLSGVTNDNGRFYIDGFKFVGEQKFAVTSVNRKAENEGWIKLDPLFKTAAFKASSQDKIDTIPESLRKQVLKRQELLVQKKNSMGNSIMLDEVKIKAKSKVIIGSVPLNGMGYKDEEFVISPGDSTYQHLSHYLLANSGQTIEDPSGKTNHILFHSGMKNTYPIFIVNKREMFVMDDVESNMVNGEGREEASNSDIDNEIRNNTLDTYYNLPMSEIERVTIKHMVGMRGMGLTDYFLIYLTLKEGSLLGAKGNPISVKTSGYYQAREFNLDAVGDKKTNESFTFYWNPLIKTDINGEASFTFKSPAKKTKLRLAVEGLESEGNPLGGDQIIEIR